MYSRLVETLGKYFINFAGMEAAPLSEQLPAKIHFSFRYPANNNLLYIAQRNIYYIRIYYDIKVLLSYNIATEEI